MNLSVQTHVIATVLGTVHLVMTCAAARVSRLVFIGTARAPRKEAATAATKESLVENCILGLEQ
jgi:nucleoside-diphosphate-sugar epimerase